MSLLLCYFVVDIEIPKLALICSKYNFRQAGKSGHIIQVIEIRNLLLVSLQHEYIPAIWHAQFKQLKISTKHSFYLSLAIAMKAIENSITLNNIIRS